MHEPRAFSTVHVPEHSLMAAKMSVLPDKTTITVQFRRALEQIAILLLTQASKDWPIITADIETPLAAITGAKLAQPIVFLCRFCGPVFDYSKECCASFPQADVRHIGLYRYELACGRSITIAVTGSSGRVPRCLARPNVAYWTQCDGSGHAFKGQGAITTEFICVVACAIGVEHLRSAYPYIPVYSAAIDPELNEFGYIVPRRATPAIATSEPCGS
jgi:uracil phosphoribosyltransferase